MIDESDWILSHRTSHQSEGAQTIRCAFLKKMSDAMHERLKIMYIATTNSPADFDEGFMRRFHKLIYVGLPNHGTISKILQARLGVHDRDEDRMVAMEVRDRRFWKIEFTNLQDRPKQHHLIATTSLWTY